MSKAFCGTAPTSAECLDESIHRRDIIFVRERYTFLKMARDGSEYE